MYVCVCCVHRVPYTYIYIHTNISSQVISWIVVLFAVCFLCLYACVYIHTHIFLCMHFGMCLCMYLFVHNSRFIQLPMFVYFYLPKTLNPKPYRTLTYRKKRRRSYKLYSLTKGLWEHEHLIPHDPEL